MTLDYKIVKEACLDLWEKYHTKIEDLGFELGKDSLMHSPEEISIIASIKPAYDAKTAKAIREIIPRVYEYKGHKIKVIVFPSVDTISRYE